MEPLNLIALAIARGLPEETARAIAADLLDLEARGLLEALDPEDLLPEGL